MMAGAVESNGTNLFVAKRSLLLVAQLGLEHLEVFVLEFLLIRRAHATLVLLPFAELLATFATGLQRSVSTQQRGQAHSPTPFPTATPCRVRASSALARCLSRRSDPN